VALWRLPSEEAGIGSLLRWWLDRV
jgi:hypothetical protein